MGNLDFASREDDDRCLTTRSAEGRRNGGRFFLCSGGEWKRWFAVVVVLLSDGL
jgi:hypothetical protein